MPIIEDIKTLVSPDVPTVINEMRSICAQRAELLRHDAPATIARAAEWALANAEEICDATAARSRCLPMSRPMLIEAIHNCVKRWTDSDRLRNLVREELQNQNVGRPLLPEIVFHNLAGNLFVSGWESITHAALTGAGSLVRCSDSDPVFPAIWAQAIIRSNPAFAGTIAVCQWPREDLGRFCPALELSDAVVCFGTDQAVQSLRQMTPWMTPFASHGSTFSFAALSAEELRNGPVEKLAQGCAYDFSAYDQQGCLSPRALFVEDIYSRDVDRFIDAVYAAMKALENKLPRGGITLEDSAALARARDNVLIDAACGGAGRQVSHQNDPFLITVKPIEQFALGPVNRYVDVYLYKQIEEIEQTLHSFYGRVSTLAIPDPKKPPVNLINTLRVSRACEFGKMQIPPLAWSLDGLRPIQKMIKFQTVQQ